MRIWGIDTNTFYLAVACVEDGRYSESCLLPPDGPARKEDHKRKPGNKNKVYENQSPRERLDVMTQALHLLLNNTSENVVPDWAYIEEPPFVNSPKTFAELTAVVMVTRSVFLPLMCGISLVNVSTWKKETIGNGAADKSEIKAWAIAHAGAPEGLTEDEYDATVLAFRGAVAAGDVH